MFQVLAICESEWSSREEQAEDKGKNVPLFYHRVSHYFSSYSGAHRAEPHNYTK